MRCSAFPRALLLAACALITAALTASAIAATGVGHSGPHGYISMVRFGSESGGFVLRTADGGATFRPQLVSQVPLFGVATASESSGFALGIDSSLFGTKFGGEAGRAQTLALTTARTRFSARQLRAAKGRISVRLKLANPAPTTNAVLSIRGLAGSAWKSQAVKLGPSGAVTVPFTIRGSVVLAAHLRGLPRAHGPRGMKTTGARLRRLLRPLGRSD